MQAVQSIPVTETAAALLDGRLRLTMSWEGENFYLGPFETHGDMDRARWLLTEPAKGHG